MLERLLNQYLADKDKCIAFMKSKLNLLDTPLLIEVIKILQEELKLRITEFEIKKTRSK